MTTKYVGTVEYHIIKDVTINADSLEEAEELLHAAYGGDDVDVWDIDLRPCDEATEEEDA